MLTSNGYITNANENMIMSNGDIINDEENSLRPKWKFLMDVASFLFAYQRTLKERGSFLSPFLNTYILYFLNGILDTCLYCKLVAPKTDLTYFLTSNAVSTRPVLS